MDRDLGTDSSLAVLEGIGQEHADQPDALTAARISAEVDFDQAIASHERWKQRLQDYLEGRLKGGLDAAVIACDDRCELGQWLNGSAMRHLGGYRPFTDLVASHRYFHRQAAEVVSHTQKGQRGQAIQILATTYRHASRQVLMRLRDLKLRLQD